MISADELKNELSLRTQSRRVEIISVTENLQSPFQVDETITISNLDTLQVDASKKYIMVCQKGISSYKATKMLKEKFPKATILSLSGGISNYEN